MDVDEERRRYGDSTMLEPIIEQQDDEMTTSRMSSSNMDTSFLEEERRAHEEIQQFEEFEEEFASNRRGVRVKFDDEQLVPMAQTTVIKTEPYFQINSTEDQVTKYFYHNEFPSKTEEENKFSRQISSKTPSEPDSLEEEYIVTFEKEKNLSYKPNKEIYNKIIDFPDQVSFSSPGKSILKKSQTKEKITTRSPSSSSLKKNLSSSSRSNSNEVLHLAEVTAKQTSSQSSTPLRSLFEPTINIFDSSYSNQSRRPSRLRYYIKPYRGETYIPPETNKQRSRSLSEQRLAQQSGSTVWYTFSNQYNRPLNRKQHVSWSPVRDYIHQGRDKIPKSPIKRYKNKQPSSSSSSLLSSTFSSSSPCLQSASSMIPISTRYRSSQNTPSSIDSYETSSLTTCSLTPVSQYEEKKEMIFISPLPDIVHPNKKEHNEAMQRYDRLLEKMRATDEQLQILSRSWTKNIQQRTSIRTNKTTNNKEFISPMILQMCLLILVIFNLLVVYFFNEINVLWSQYISHTAIAEQGTSNFS